MANTIIIGSGIAGLSAACSLAHAGIEVLVVEKNEQPGGRARSFSADGFIFDMGPSWYWMPDVFERFFNKFGKHTSTYYTCQRLDPSYQVIWEDETIKIPANYNQLHSLFEHIEKGAGNKLDKFIKQAGIKYDRSMHSLVYKPGLSVLEFITKDVIKSLSSIDLLKSMHSHLRSFFSHPKLLQLMEFPILFLGALPENTPALYSLMNYADVKLGTWYPKGGMVSIVNALFFLAKELGVQFRFGESVLNIMSEHSNITGVKTCKATYVSNAVIAACDYHHAEQLLPVAYRNYSERYWEKRKMAPSCLLYYIGLNKKVNGLEHHNLFFDAPFDKHTAALYTDVKWPDKPLFYVCCPSKTDDNVAPANCENLFILIPVAPGLEDNEVIRNKYYEIVMERMETRLQQNIKNAVVYRRDYAYTDFVTDYNAYKGNAYGLANTLMQTAFMKPSVRNKKLKNLFYTGQLTVPGPGLPPAIISGEIVAMQVQQLFNTKAT